MIAKLTAVACIAVIAMWTQAPAKRTAQDRAATGAAAPAATVADDAGTATTLPASGSHLITPQLLAPASPRA